VELSNDLLVVKLYFVKNKDVGLAMEIAKETSGVLSTNGRGPQLEHLADLYGNACDGFENNRNFRILHNYPLSTRMCSVTVTMT